MKKPEVLFQTALHQAIFNFCIALIQQYKSNSLSSQESLKLTSNWLRSLADKLEQSSQEILDQDQQFISNSQKESS